MQSDVLVLAHGKVGSITFAFDMMHFSQIYVCMLSMSSHTFSGLK